MSRGAHGPVVETGNGPLAREMRESLAKERQERVAGPSQRVRSEFEAKRLGMSPLIPTASEFGSSDFLEVPALRELSDSLVHEYEELGFLDGYTLRVLWKAAGGKKGGRAHLGACSVATGLVAFFGIADWVIWLAADHCRELEFTDEQVEALLYHELLHCALKGEKDPAPACVGHDFEGFGAEIRRYGFWNDSSQRARAAVQGRMLLDGSGSTSSTVGQDV